VIDPKRLEKMDSAKKNPEEESVQSLTIEKIDRISDEKSRCVSGRQKDRKTSMVIVPLGEFFRALVKPMDKQYLRHRISHAINKWVESFVIEAKKYEVDSADPERPKRESVDFK
tara:strand:+ start:13887 stop:14228 length:342 start_codon:yes stop_codon:yes gene_type:complete